MDAFAHSGRALFLAALLSAFQGAAAGEAPSGAGAVFSPTGALFASTVASTAASDANGQAASASVDAFTSASLIPDWGTGSAARAAGSKPAAGKPGEKAKGARDFKGSIKGSKGRVVGGDAASSAAAASAAPSKVVTVGVLDTADLVLQRPMMVATQEKLTRAMPGTRFQLRVILSADAPAQIETQKPDFLFAPAGMVGMLQKEGVESYRIATRKSPLAKEASRSTGSVFVALKGRTDLEDLKDLKGKAIVAGLPDSVPGWLAAMGEIQKAGFDPEDFFGSTEFLSEVYPEIIATLWGGRVDAVVLPTCLLEALGREGLVAVDELKVIHEKSDEALACKCSTDLYPDISLIGFSWTPEQEVRDVSVALMSGGPGKPSEWLAFVSHAGVDQLFRSLKAGPFAYLRDFTPRALYARYPAVFWTVGLLLLSLVLYGALLQGLVRRRTRELSETLAEQRRMEAEARDHRRRLGYLERRNIVNQMSGMIAHEINSPVGAICNFKAILEFTLPEDAKQDPGVRVALDGIESEAQRIAGIVGRVRSYAKQQKHAHKPCDLVAIAKRAVRALHLSSSVKAEVRERYEVPKAPVRGDALELELLVLNLLRNASEVKPREGGRVKIGLELRETEDGRYCVRIEDNGEALTDEQMARLAAMMQSVKPEGLGMGLSIVRGIADSHGAELAFGRGKPGGLVVTFTMEADAQEAPSAEALRSPRIAEFAPGAGEEVEEVERRAAEEKARTPQANQGENTNA